MVTRPRPLRIPLKLWWLALAARCPLALAHPVPDIPVRAEFAPDGTVTLRAEVDPRCFAADPLNEPYLENATFQEFSDPQKRELVAKTLRLLSETVEIRFLPEGAAKPKFHCQFTTLGSRELTWDTKAPETNTPTCAELPVTVTAEWKTDASRFQAYQVKSGENGKFSLVVLSSLNGQAQPPNVLFPGEESRPVDLAAWAAQVKRDG
jgi:hypothetical protein